MMSNNDYCDFNDDQDQSSDIETDYHTSDCEDSYMQEEEEDWIQNNPFSNPSKATTIATSNENPTTTIVAATSSSLKSVSNGGGTINTRINNDNSNNGDNNDDDENWSQESLAVAKQSATSKTGKITLLPRNQYHHLHSKQAPISLSSPLDTFLLSSNNNNNKNKKKQERINLQQFNLLSKEEISGAEKLGTVFAILDVLRFLASAFIFQQSYHLITKTTLNDDVPSSLLSSLFSNSSSLLIGTSIIVLILTHWTRQSLASSFLKSKLERKKEI